MKEIKDVRIHQNKLLAEDVCLRIDGQKDV
jgi:hypothetical protein